MTLVDLYFYLFTDSILASLVFVPNVEMAYIVMKVFGYYNQALVVLIAILGNIVGSSVSYFFGYAVRSLKQHVNNYADSTKLLNLASVANKHLAFLGIFSFFSIWGVLLVCVAGFFRVSFVRFMLYVLVGRVAYYLLPIFIS
jgi:membrane protein YqaA with SNARE-associated domain